jgi:hypothetical protein
MRDDEATFVEAMGQAMADSGMPRMAGRMWAWLLICDPPQQSAAELAEALDASRGAISGTARLLTTAGIIQRSTRRGDRREYFNVAPGSIQRLIEGGGAKFRAMRELGDRGLALLDGRPEALTTRIRELRDVYAFFEREFPTILERFVAHRKDIA